MRNLVVGADGTWNKPDQMDRGRQVPSNVIKIVRAVDENSASIEHKRYYDSGVGTAGWLDKIRGGATGNGLFKNMRDAYAWLIRNHLENDRIFLFGFSRGAYTVRSLTGMLALCGIPKCEHEPETLAKEAAKAYRERDKAKRKELAEKFRATYSCSAGDVHFLGVWDTVGALGLPTKGVIGALTRARHAFHDVTLGSNVQHAYQALAINERRGPFEPALWRGEQSDKTDSVVQAWFPGVHSNVGGGYVDVGLSDRALYWMIVNAQRHGLEFNRRYLEKRMDPNWFGELRESFSWYYKTPLTGGAKWREIGTEALGECIHFSALRRWNSATHPDDVPLNLHLARANKDIRIAEDAHEEGYHEETE